MTALWGHASVGQVSDNRIELEGGLTQQFTNEGICKAKAGRMSAALKCEASVTHTARHASWDASLSFVLCSPPMRNSQVPPPPHLTVDRYRLIERIPSSQVVVLPFRQASREQFPSLSLTLCFLLSSSRSCIVVRSCVFLFLTRHGSKSQW